MGWPSTRNGIRGTDGRGPGIIRSRGTAALELALRGLARSHSSGEGNQDRRYGRCLIALDRNHPC